MCFLNIDLLFYDVVITVGGVERSEKSSGAPEGGALLAPNDPPCQIPSYGRNDAHGIAFASCSEAEYHYKARRTISI